MGANKLVALLGILRLAIENGEIVTAMLLVDFISVELSNRWEVERGDSK